MKLLADSVMNQNKILIDIGSNRRIIANIIVFDNNFNMVLTNITEKWSEKCSRKGIWVQKKVPC